MTQSLGDRTSRLIDNEEDETTRRVTHVTEMLTTDGTNLTQPMNSGAGAGDYPKSLRASST